MNGIEERLKQIHSRIGDRHASVKPTQQEEDIVWLLQVVELQQAQIGILSAPEHVRRLLHDFSTLTTTRQALVLELMREMKEAQNEFKT